MNSLKSQVKVIGWDDGPFEIGQSNPVPVVGVVMRGGDFVEGVIKTTVKVDGTEGTGRLISTIKKSKHRNDLGLTILDGITVGGLNVIDIKQLMRETGIPVLAVTRKKPDPVDFRRALRKVPNSDSRCAAARKAGKPKSVTLENRKVYYQKSGLSDGEAERAISITSSNSSRPEPVRIAGMIARSLVDGES